MKHPPSAKIFEFVEMLDRAVKERGALTAQCRCIEGGVRKWLAIVFNEKSNYRAVDRFADFLGFNGSWELESWACFNWRQWGNKDGMFVVDPVPDAFEPSDFEMILGAEFPAFVLTNHWRGVAGRVKDYELTLASR